GQSSLQSTQFHSLIHNKVGKAGFNLYVVDVACAHTAAYHSGYLSMTRSSLSLRSGSIVTKEVATALPSITSTSHISRMNPIKYSKSQKVRV
ncbi:hypothetical protein PROFUN_13347, partial [Planoprotostelium fungivorum]